MDEIGPDTWKEGKEQTLKIPHANDTTHAGVHYNITWIKYYDIL